MGGVSDSDKCPGLDGGRVGGADEGRGQPCQRAYRTYQEQSTKATGFRGRTRLEALPYRLVSPFVLRASQRPGLYHSVLRDGRNDRTLSGVERSGQGWERLMAGSLKTFWYVVTGRWPERPPGGWTVAEIQARGSKQGFATFAGCQPDELLDLVLKRSWWRTWVWPDFSVLYGRAGTRFGATGVGAAVGGPLGAGIGAVVGGWRSDREALARARAAVPEGRVLRPELMTPAVTFLLRVLLLNIVGIALFFAALILAAGLMAIDPGVLDKIIAFFAGVPSAQRSIQQISLDLLYLIMIIYCVVLIICLLNHLLIFYKSIFYSPFIYKIIQMGGSGLFAIVSIFFFPLMCYFLYGIIFGHIGVRKLSDYIIILMFPLLFIMIISTTPAALRVCYLMLCIRRSGKLPSWLRLET